MKPNSMYKTNDDGEPALMGRIVYMNVVPGVLPAPDRGDGFRHWEKTGRLDVSAELVESATNGGNVIDETKFYDVIRGPGLYRCADGSTVRITFRHEYAQRFQRFEYATDVHVWQGDNGIPYRPNGQSADAATRPHLRITSGPVRPDPRPDAAHGQGQRGEPTMKYALIFIAMLVIASVLLWAIGAYVALEPNPLNWVDAGRFTHASLSILGAIVGTVCYADLVERAFTAEKPTC